MTTAPPTVEDTFEAEWREKMLPLLATAFRGRELDVIRAACRYAFGAGGRAACTHFEWELNQVRRSN
jgi:hypothetical protein